MKKLLSLSVTIFTLLLAQAQEFPNKNWQSLVDSERAFARMAKEKNTRDAFLANLID